MAATISTQPLRSPLGTARAGGQQLPVYISTEWSKSYAELIAALRAAQAEIESLKLRVTALE